MSDDIPDLPGFIEKRPGVFWRVPARPAGPVMRQAADCPALNRQWEARRVEEEKRNAERLREWVYRMYLSGRDVQMPWDGYRPSKFLAR